VRNPLFHLPGKTDTAKARITSTTPEGQIYGFEVLLGLGTGCFVQAGYAVIQSVVPPAEMAYAISFMMLAQLCGIAFGMAIAGAVFINNAVTSLSAVLPDATREQLQLALSGTSGHYLSTLGVEVREAATDAIVQALQKVFIPVYVGAAFCLVLSVLFTVSCPLHLPVPVEDWRSLAETNLGTEAEDVW
jgi:hypothetical protein